jgi:Cupin-like domain
VSIESVTMAAVPRLTVEEWRECSAAVAAAEKPVVIEAALAGSRAVRDWSPGYFRDSFGDRAVGVTLRTPENGDIRRWKDSRTLMPLGEFVDHLESHSRCYLHQIPLANFGAGLLGHLELGRLDDRLRRVDDDPDNRRVHFWLGRGTVVPLHFDRYPNYLVQVHGRKRAVLEPPGGPPGQYVYAGNEHVSHVDPSAPDLEAFPDYRPGEAVEAALDAGDALFIPALWWHQITSDGVSISVNVWYGDGVPLESIDPARPRRP